VKKSNLDGSSKEIIADNQMVRCSVWIYSIYKYIQYGSYHMIDIKKETGIKTMGVIRGKP